MDDRAFWLVLRTVGPEGGEPPGGSASAVPATVLRDALALADANGLLYAFAVRWQAAGGTLPSFATDAWRSAQEGAAALRGTLDLLNETARATGLEYLVIKDSSTLENIPRDVDIFVRERDRDAFLRALAARGMQVAYDDQAETSLSSPGFLRIDVYSRIHYLNRDFLDPDYLFASRRSYGTHGVEHPGLTRETAVLLNSAHDIFGHAALTLLDFLDLRALRHEIPDRGRLAAVAGAQGWGRVFALWERHLDRLEQEIYGEGRPVHFPVRNGRRFILQCARSLDGEPLGTRERRALSLSLLWDDFILFSEELGLVSLLKRSGIATLAGNTAGHRLRLLRGDRKSLGTKGETRPD